MKKKNDPQHMKNKRKHKIPENEIDINFKNEISRSYLLMKSRVPNEDQQIKITTIINIMINYSTNWTKIERIENY